jgi:4-hydroxybenzoate polyprenyltransferase
VSRALSNKALMSRTPSWIRATVAITRPPVFALLALYAALGLARAGQADAYGPLLEILVVIAAFLVFSVACNDLADEAIDRVNLPGDRRRPLVVGSVSRGQLRATGLAAASMALAVSALLGWRSLLVTAAGLGLSAAYSLRPVRVADRGALASLLLPACYVAVPYLLGIYAVHGAVSRSDLTLPAGLYLGFIGRILLKDFRDVRGDALFGKRTFLVRHGRRRTCAVSAGFWAVGTAVVLGAAPSRSYAVDVLPVCVGACALFALVLIAALSARENPRRDEPLISAVAILGRGMILLLLAHLSLRDIGVAKFPHLVLMALLGVVTLLQATAMARRGPIARARNGSVDALYWGQPLPEALGAAAREAR